MSPRTDHAYFMAENYEEILKVPGIPYLRINTDLIAEEFPESLFADDEQLLLAMHGKSNKILLISNKTISIYQIPEKKSLLRIVAPTGIKMGLGFVPFVGEMIDASDKLLEGGEKVKGLVEWSAGKLTGKKKKEREETLKRLAEGMPTKNDIEDVVWDLGKPEILAMILCYREKILLENGFEWKTQFKASLENKTNEPNTITVDKSGVQFVIGGKKASIDYPGKKWDPINLLTALLEINQPAIEGAGWRMETGDRKITFKQERQLGIGVSIEDQNKTLIMDR